MIVKRLERTSEEDPEEVELGTILQAAVGFIAKALEESQRQDQDDAAVLASWDELEDDRQAA